MITEKNIHICARDLTAALDGQFKTLVFRPTTGGTPSHTPHVSAPQERALEVLSRSNLAVELSTKERQVLQLTEDVQTLHSSLGRVRETSAEQIGQLRRELETRKAALKVGRGGDPRTS